MSYTQEETQAIGKVIVTILAGFAAILLLMAGEWWWFVVVTAATAASYVAKTKPEGTAKTHHGLHIVMTFITGGIWLIPWFLLHQRTKTRRHREVIAAMKRDAAKR